MIRFAAICGLSLGLVLGACGGGGTNLHLFSTDWTDDHGASMEAVRQRVGGAKPTAATDVVVAVAGNADKIVGLPLSGAAKWSFAHPLDARPIVTGTVVVASGGGKLFALDASNGKSLWERPTGGLALHGAGDNGGVTAITLTQVSGRGSVLLAVTHDGAIVRQVESDKILGAPAVLSRIAFVPWSSQYVSAIDLSDGDEVGRVVLREKTSRAWTKNGALYFGEVGLFRFDDKIRLASSGGATHASLPVRELPGTPLLMASGNDRQSPVASAPDRIRLFARPTAPDAPLAIADDRFYGTYFRIVMGFESKKGGLSWVHLHPSDVLGGDVADGALVVCDEDGKVTSMGAKSGGVLGELDLGEPVKSCTVQIDQWHPSGSPSKVESLARQIAASVKSHEPQLATANRFLLRELATLDDEEATRTLVELAADRRAAPVLVSEARGALANRRNGARYMIEALGKHYDYLRDELLAPPVGPMAQALAAMNDKSAGPALAAHLLDPADDDDDVKQAAAALAILGGPSEVPALKQFFGMYRANAEGEQVSAAVVSAGQALIKLGGKDGRAVVDQALADPMTVPLARERLDALVRTADGAKTGEGEKK
jgi:outer membrane protein assembly factor BamB